MYSEFKYLAFVHEMSAPLPENLVKKYQNWQPNFDSLFGVDR